MLENDHRVFCELEMFLFMESNHTTICPKSTKHICKYVDCSKS